MEDSDCDHVFRRWWIVGQCFDVSSTVDSSVV